MADNATATSNRRDEESSPTGGISVETQPHEGLGAWLQAIGALFVYIATWGFLSAYGSYQKFYETRFLRDTPPSSIAWIGTLQGVILIMGGAITGPIYDLGFARELLVIGTIITVLGIMMISLSTEYYQILLSQGVCVGVGSALLYVPSISIVVSAFHKHRPLASFVATSGTAVGGVIYPVIFSQLQPRVGFAWTTRVLGFITLFELVLALAIMLPRLKRGKGAVRALFDVSAFKDSNFMAFCFALFLMWTAYWVPFFSLPTVAQFKGHARPEFAFYILVICNAATIPGRYLAVPISNAFGPTRSMCGFAFASSILFFGWIGVASVAGVIVWAVLIALFMGPLAVMYPIIVPSLTPRKELIGTRMGISSAFAALGTLIGFPVTSALDDVESGIFWKSQLFNGCCMLGGAALMGYISIKVALQQK